MVAHKATVEASNTNFVRSGSWILFLFGSGVDQGQRKGPDQQHCTGVTFLVPMQDFEMGFIVIKVYVLKGQSNEIFDLQFFFTIWTNLGQWPMG